MKLTYRGVTYDYNPPKVEYGDRTQAGKYRGVDVRFRNIKKPPVLQPTLDLIYRGVAHTIGDTEVTNAGVEAKQAAQPALAADPTKTAGKAITPSVQDQARFLMMGHHKAVKRRQQTMLSRLDARVGLTANDAVHFWNHIGGEVHPSFGDSYDRSHAAMS
jgi:hypothetical protein